MLCSTRSNPLTHITRARYLFAALLLLILISGAGWYPWLAVAGIYAIPVAWNLVVIAGHTGFHVVPAVVYAPVAVVCAVGVWRAARPRPEALAMPRPPAPGSLAPGLPPSRPPALRRLLTFVALAVMLIAAAVPAVSAEYYSEDISYLDYHFASVGNPGYFTGGAAQTLTSMRFYNIENCRDMRLVRAFEDTTIGYYTGGATRPGFIVPDYPVSFPVTYSIGGNTVGNGTYGSFKNGKIGYAWVTFENWDVSSYTGQQTVLIKKTSGGTTDMLSAQSLSYDYGTWSPDNDHRVIFLAGSYTIGATHEVYSTDVFKNRYTLQENAGLYTLDLTRDIDGKNYNSYLYVKSGDTVLLDGKKVSNTNYKLGGIVDTPIDIGIKSVSGKWFNKTYSSTAPSAATVTVYIQNSQTGALLANAHLSILAAAGGTETEVVNATLPGGTGTYSLEKADYLKYHASATADGYTLLSPILFGVPENGTTIVLWMAPDAPPDNPIEEGKSMLYGYVQTQGSQQPIAGATVSLDSYGSTTTSSTGFYLFNNVTPDTYTISASAPLHDALSEPVTVDPAATPHNLALKGHFLLTVSAKDADDLTTLHNTTISLSDGQESTQNPATFSADYGPYTITAAAGGYYPQTQSAYLDKPGTTTATVLLTARPEPVPPPEMPNYPPHNVKFTVQTLLGTPIPGVNVTAQGIQQTPSTNIIERLLGINTTSTPITTELMSGTTDTNGEINFMMIEAVKYRISLYKPDSVNQTLEIYPKEDTYPIIISTAGGPLLPDAGDALRDIRINVTTSTEGDTGHILVDYNDTTHKTTSLTVQVTQQNTTNTSAPEDVIASHTVANDANVTHTFDLPNYKGQSFFVRLEAEHPDFGTINRDYAVAFKGVRVPLGPLPDGLYIYVAGFGLMLLGGIFGATSATRGVVVIAFAGWLFYAFGWLDDLGLIAPASLGLVSTIAVMGVIVTRYREEGYT